MGEESAFISGDPLPTLEFSPLQPPRVLNVPAL